MAFAVLATFSLTFVSCSSDDDDDDNDGGNASGKVPSPVFVDLDGNKVQISSIGDYSFFYNEAGRLTSFSRYDDTYTVDKSSFTISKKYYDDGYDIFTAYVTLNNEGLISTIRYVDEWTEDNGTGFEKEDCTISYTYNSSKQLVGVSSNYREDVRNGTTQSLITVTLTWENDNLIKSVLEEETSRTYQGSTGEQHSNWTTTISNTFNYGTQSNPVKQFPYSMSGVISYSKSTDLGMCLLGLLGVGPANLPTSSTTVTTYSSGSPNTSNSTYSFVLNSNGTINTEKVGSPKSQYTSSYTWEYGNTSRVVIENVGK